MHAVRKLFRERGKLMAELEGEEEAQAVSLVYPRPISARDREVSVMDEQRKKEYALLPSLDALDPESHKLAKEILYLNYRICQITKIYQSYVNHGHRYLKVATDRGDRYFNLREPGKNVTHLSDDHLVIGDSMGNRYEIPSIATLDRESRSHLGRVL